MYKSNAVRNYEISRNGEELYVRLLRSDKIFYATYTKELYDLLKSGVLTGGAECGGYLRFFYNKESVYFHQIAYCCYYRNLTTDNYRNSISEFKNELTKNDLCLDHLTGNKENNTTFNLSLMPRNDNSRKGIYERVFKDIFSIISAFDGYGYRVGFFYLRKQQYTQLYYCHSHEELSKLFRYLGRNKWSIRKSALGEISTDGFFLVKGKLFQRLIPTHDELHLQRALLRIDVKMFTKYRCNDTDLVL